MTKPDQHNAMAASSAFAALAGHIEAAGGSPANLKTVVWMIGAHPSLIAHRRVFANLNQLLQHDVFSDESLYWASAWREQVRAWVHTLDLIEHLGPVLSGDPALQAMYKSPRHDRDHPLLRHGVTRHPIAAALFNTLEPIATVPSVDAEPHYQLLRASIIAIYFESRWRAAKGLEEFMLHSGLKEFSAVPLGAGPVGLCMRAFSLAGYAPLLLQLPLTTCILEFAARICTLQPDFAAVALPIRNDAARYFTDLQRYLNTLPTLLNATALEPRVKRRANNGAGEGGHALQPGWVEGGAGITRELDLDWVDGGPPITVISLPIDEEPDPNEEEEDGDHPGAHRDTQLELYDATDAATIMSRMRFRRLAIELRQQDFEWSVDMASRSNRERAMQLAQARITAFAKGSSNNKSKARLEAIGGMLVKAAALFGWSPRVTSNIAIQRINAFEQRTLESLAYIKQDRIILLVTQDGSDPAGWNPVGFLVPGLSPRYATQLPADFAATGRERQTAFILADAGGLGVDILEFATLVDRLPKSDVPLRRALGVETETARALARDCAKAASDPACDDPHTVLTVERLCNTVRTAIAQVCGDAVPSWLVTFDEHRQGEARLHYTQVRAANLTKWHAQALSLLEGGDWSDTPTSPAAALQSGWVGCRHVADLDKVLGLIDSLQTSTQTALDLERRSEIRRYHNDFTLLSWVEASMLNGLRPAATDGPSLQNLYELRRGLDMFTRFDAAGFIDKHHAYQDKARLLLIDESHRESVVQLERHNAAVIQRLDLFAAWKALDAGAQRLFVINDDESLSPVTPTWIKTQLAKRGVALPPNFGRALLRTEMLDRGVSGRIIDGLLGHFNHGQSWFSKHSTHNPSAHLEAVQKLLPEYREILHLGRKSSLCVSASDEKGALTKRIHLPSTGLKVPPLRPRLKPLWAGCHFPPTLPDSVQAVWAAVARHAAPSDRIALIGLQWTLKNSVNPHSKLLTGRPLAQDETADGDSARALENELLLVIQRHGQPRTVAASWLRLTLAAIRRNQELGIDIAATMVAAISSPPDSPITAKATLRLADLAAWRSALHQWIQLRSADPEDDPRYWAIAIALSAVVNGMVLDPLLLFRVVGTLAEPGLRRLQLCNGAEGHSFLAIWLPSSTPGGKQLTRWFLDPLTELLILRAPPFPNVPTLRSMAKDLNRFLIHHGTPPHRCPGGWRVVIRTARAFWSTRAPQHLVQVAHRGISTTSLQESTWQRLFGSSELQSSKPGRTPLATTGQTSELKLMISDDSNGMVADGEGQLRLDRNAAIAHASAISGADVDHTTLDLRSAHPWLHHAWEALAPDSGVAEATVRLKRLDVTSSDDFRHGALNWLVRTLLGLSSEATAESGNVLIGLRRVASTLLPRLVAEMGNRWFAAMSPSECIRTISAVTDELETDASRPDLRRGVRLLLRFEPALAGLREEAAIAAASGDKEDDTEDGDQDDRVDARLFTVDEYEKAGAVLQIGINPPLPQEEQQDVLDLLDMGTWSLARPREYVEVRLGDVEQHGEEISMMVREYPGHTLKTPQAFRRVPLSLLAPAAVIARLKARIARLKTTFRDPNGAEALRSLLFPPPAGVDAGVYHDRLLRHLREVLRRVTGDTGFRVYSLRHAGANWLLLALEGDNHALCRRVWSAHPAMAQWLQEGPALRQRLLGSDDRTDRRALLAITKIMGHLASATTYMHYLHLSHLLQLEAVVRLTEELPHSVLADAAGIARSSYSEQRAGGWQHVLALARSRAGWTTVESHEADAQGLQVETEGAWLAFEDLAGLLNAHTRHRRPLASMAIHFSLQPERVTAMIAAAVELRALIGAELTETPGSDAAPEGVWISKERMNPAERSQAHHLLLNIQECWNRDPITTRDAVSLLVLRTDRHHREWRFCDPDEVDRCLTFLANCKVGPYELQIVLRRRHQTAQVPAWAHHVLGRYAASAVKIGNPDTHTSDESLERWIGFRLVDRRGDGIPNVTARALFSAWVNMAGQLRR